MPCEQKQTRNENKINVKNISTEMSDKEQHSESDFYYLEDRTRSGREKQVSILAKLKQAEISDMES